MRTLLHVDVYSKRVVFFCVTKVIRLYFGSSLIRVVIGPIKELQPPSQSRKSKTKTCNDSLRTLSRGSGQLRVFASNLINY